MTKIGGNHSMCPLASGKNRANRTRRLLGIFMYFVWTIYGTDMAKSFAELFCFILDYVITFDFIVGEHENIDFS